eukprot:725631-Prymnesium_polylepis.1
MARVLWRAADHLRVAVGVDVRPEEVAVEVGERGDGRDDGREAVVFVEALDKLPHLPMRVGVSG